MFNSFLYKRSPVWLQEGLISARAGMRILLRENTRFHRVLEEIERTQWLSDEALRSLQFANLRALLQHSVQNIPYYRALFKQEGIQLADIASLEDVRKIPFLEKATILNYKDDLVATNMRGIRFRVTTSGSTGTPLVMFQDLNAVVRENAFIWRQLHWAGFRRGQRRAWIRGDMVTPFTRQEPPFWRVSRPDHMLMMSSYHLSEVNAPQYLSALEAFNPVLIQAYPSSIAYLARYLEASGREYGGASLRAVVTTSETLTDADREVIERRMGARVYQQYGSAERVTMIHTCENGTYHVDSDYGFTEFLPLGGERYEIVGTGFNNWLMPLVRYRSGDSVEMELERSSCPCGRQLPIVKRIHGRKDDYLKVSDGRRIGRIDHIFKGVKNIAEAQLIQDRLDEVTVRLVPLKDYGEEDEEKLLENAHERLGEDMQIRVERVRVIPRTTSGKFKAVICNV
jgi:phenylacetate-CoA ligase